MTEAMTTHTLTRQDICGPTTALLHGGQLHPLKGQLGAWALRQPQWQHWGELADVGQGAESTAQGTGTAPMGADADGCDETADATERETGTAADADAKACMADVWVVGSVGGW